MRKRRRTTFKRRGVNQTSKATTGQSLAFKAKRLSRKRYKNLLWTSTIMAPHYRSLQSNAATIVTQANEAVGTIGLDRPLRLGSNAFWVTAGGAQNINFGTTIPLFSGDIILRGGMWGMQFRNGSATLPIGIKVYVGRTMANPTASLPGTSNVGWDPSLVSEFKSEYGKITYNTVVQLEPGESFKLERRVGIQKIDQNVWSAYGNMPFVLVHVYNIGHATAVTCNVLTYYNLSFSADAIGTT